MKAKKKINPSTKKPAKKPLPRPQLLFVDKTLVTTKEKTHNTLEDPIQIKDLRLGPRSARNNPTRLSCLQKMQECNLSPFSSPNRSSFSPRLRKTLSPYAQDEKDRIKIKGKTKTQADRHPQKKKHEVEKKQSKPKGKMTKEQCNFAYQNQLLKKLNEKKITQMSQQSSNSVKKLKKINQLKVQIPHQKKQFDIGRNKIQRVKELRKKIQDKNKKQFPTLNKFQMSFLCSIVLIQRLWRQSRIKKFINDFISPRSNPECNITGDLGRDSSSPPHLDYTLTTEAQTSELIRKYHTFSFQKKKIGEHEVRSSDLCIHEKKIDLKGLELSSQLTPERQIKMVQFVECLRDITIYKPQKSKKKQRINVFNLKESLSEKCLMQSFYEKIFKQSPSKVNNFQIFKSKKEEKNLERSIELIQTISSPNKHQQVIMEERFETELQSKDTLDGRPAIVTAQISVETDPDIEYNTSSKEISSLKQLNILSEGVIFLLLNEFCDEYHGFASKSTLKKKKKNILPGIRSSQNSIREYLKGLTSYMFSSYGDEVVRRFSLINPLSFLKIHHEYDEDDDYIEEEDEDLNLPIIPQTLYYDYQQIYEDEHFMIPEDDKKYSNFLESLIKIHNLSLINCLSQLVEKTRMERIILPWDVRLDPMRNKSKDSNQKALKGIIDSIVDTICTTSFMRVGQFHKSIENDSIQEERLLRSINMEYRNEGSDWSTQYELLELRMELTKKIEEVVLEEIINQMSLFM